MLIHSDAGIAPLPLRISQQLPNVLTYSPRVAAGEKKKVSGCDFLLLPGHQLAVHPIPILSLLLPQLDLARTTAAQTQIRELCRQLELEKKTRGSYSL